MENDSANNKASNGDTVNLVTTMEVERIYEDDDDEESDIEKGYVDDDDDHEIELRIPSSTTITARLEIDQEHHEFVPIEKLGGYTDLVFALCLVSAVFPLTTSVNGYDISYSLRSILSEEFGNIVVYAVTFAMLWAVWQQHCWVFAGFEQVGDTILILNAVFLLCVTTLPYFASFLASHRHTPLSIQLFSFSLMIMGLIMAVIVACAYRKRKMLIREFRHRRYVPSLVEYLLAFGIHTLLAALSVAVSSHSVLASYIFILLAIFSGTCAAFCMVLYKYFFVKTKPARLLWTQFFTRLSNRPLPTNRLRALIDGVFAVVGMLIIVNLISEMAPHHRLSASQNMSSLDSTLKVILYQEREILLAHGAAFVTTGMMWYIHLMISNHVTDTNRYMRTALQLMLTCVGLTPYSFRLLIRYSRNARENKSLQENEDTTVMFHCGILLFASVMQFLYWISANWNKHKLLIYQHFGRHHIKSLTLLLVYPILNLTLFLLVLKSGTVTAMTVWRVQTGSIVVFLAIKLVFEIYTHVSRRIPSVKCEMRQSVRDDQLANPDAKRCTCERVVTRKDKDSIRDVTKTSGIEVTFLDSDLDT